MTTDTKAVARYRAKLSHGLIEVEMHPAGAFVVFTDHERVVGELEQQVIVAEDEYIKQDRKIEELSTALAASRAEVEGLKRDAERWRYARTIFAVEHIESAYELCGHPAHVPCEEESVRADQAIDIAMGEENV